MRDIKDMNKHTRVIEGNFKRGVLARVVDNIKDWSTRRAAARHLHGLTDQLLNDIGIDRYQIDVAVRRPVGRIRVASRKIHAVQDSADIRHAA